MAEKDIIMPVSWCYLMYLSILLQVYTEFGWTALFGPILSVSNYFLNLI